MLFVICILSEPNFYGFVLSHGVSTCHIPTLPLVRPLAWVWARTGCSLIGHLLVPRQLLCAGDKGPKGFSVPEEEVVRAAIITVGPWPDLTALRPPSSLWLYDQNLSKL